LDYSQIARSNAIRIAELKVDLFSKRYSCSDFYCLAQAEKIIEINDIVTPTFDGNNTFLSNFFSLKTAELRQLISRLLLILTVSLL